MALKDADEIGGLITELIDLLDSDNGPEAFKDLLDMAESVLEDDLREDDDLTEQQWQKRNLKSWEILDLLRELADEFSR